MTSKDTLLYDLHVDAMPPSTNKLYRIVRGRPIKSAEAVLFETAARLQFLASFTGNEPVIPPDMALVCTITVYRPDLENAGYPKKTKERYKRWDATNQVKLIEDVAAKLLGINDSQFLDSHVQKRAGHAHARLEVHRFVAEAPGLLVDILR